MPQPVEKATTLLADAGGTSIGWALKQGEKNDIQKEKHPNDSIKRIKTKGFHPYHNKDTRLVEILKNDVLPLLDNSMPGKVIYYGTGCSNEEMSTRVEKVLQTAFPDADLEVHHDMLGAARATCGNKSGIVCILGTGSNSCLYDGREIVRQQISLGYILGDEGSGANLGKRLLTEALYEALPDRVLQKFNAFAKEHYGNENLLKLLYNNGNPSQFLASFVPFITENMDEMHVQHIVTAAFEDFFERHISVYQQDSLQTIHFSGGLSIAFKSLLETLCSQRNWSTGVFTGDPLDGLIKFHFH